MTLRQRSERPHAALDLPTAKNHGVCPCCEGYGGCDGPDPCVDNDLCRGSCEQCWCPGCHDGRGVPERCGSWRAYVELWGEAA